MSTGPKIPCTACLEAGDGTCVRCGEKVVHVSHRTSDALGSAELAGSIACCLGLGKSRPTKYLLDTLADLADKLIDRCNYDDHGHEEMRYTINEARERSKELHEIHRQHVLSKQ